VLRVEADALFKAVNARDKNFTEAKMKRRLERIDESVQPLDIGQPGYDPRMMLKRSRAGDAVPGAS
jgi:hypothetical protein